MKQKGDRKIQMAQELRELLNSAKEITFQLDLDLRLRTSRMDYSTRVQKRIMRLSSKLHTAWYLASNYHLGLSQESVRDIAKVLHDAASSVHWDGFRSYRGSDLDICRNVTKLIQEAQENLSSCHDIYRSLDTTQDYVIKDESGPIKALKILEIFSWFCSHENRENLAFTACNLKKDNREMREKKHSTHLIRSVLFWHVSTTILVIIWDGFLRFIEKILPITKIINRIKGL